MRAPIALFAFRRLRHLARTLDTLRSNPEASSSNLFVFCDAARNETELAEVEAVRGYVGEIKGFREVRVTCREANFGLARNITQGVGEVLSSHRSVIVLEDDLELSPYFLRYMNEALAAYEGSPDVGNITGYCYPVRQQLPETFLVRGPQSWSWATWADRWSHYDSDGKSLLERLEARGATEEFDIDGSAEYTAMLRNQIAGRNDSWAIRWYASCFLRGWLTLYPGRSLVRNIGTDGSGTHGRDDFHAVSVHTKPIRIDPLPAVESDAGRAAFRDFFMQLKYRNKRNQLIWKYAAPLRRLYRLARPRN